MLSRVFALAIESGHVEKNPCRNLGKLLKKVERQQSDEVSQVDSWSRKEVATLLKLVEVDEPTFYPLLVFLLSTGCRKGEALGLKWQDIDFQGARVIIRRALVRVRLGTPKSGGAQSVALSCWYRCSKISQCSAAASVSSTAGKRCPNWSSVQRRVGSSTSAT